LLAFFLSLPPVVDIVVFRLGLVCPPYGIIKKKKKEKKKKEDDKKKEQEEDEE
jgi:hypothetical protein